MHAPAIVAATTVAIICLNDYHTKHFRLIALSHLLLGRGDVLRTMIALHGNVHGNNLPVHNDNGQHPVATHSLVKNLIKNFLIKNVFAVIFVKTTADSGDGGGIVGRIRHLFTLDRVIS